jgi:hypothetical protein
MKMISGKMIFFPCLVAFRKMLRKIFCRRAGGEACVFGKWFTNKKFVNHFLNFNKGFSVNKIILKKTPANLKIFSGKYFTAK